MSALSLKMSNDQELARAQEVIERVRGELDYSQSIDGAVGTEYRLREILTAYGETQPERPGEPQTLVVSHEDLCGCVLDDCEFKKGWRAAVRAAASGTVHDG